MKFIKWLKSYWYYYKFHTLAALFVLIVVGVLIYQGVTAVEPDLCVYWLTRDPVAFETETTSQLEKRIADYTGDLNGDGKVRVEVVTYLIGDEYKNNRRSEFVTEYVGGGIMLMICDDYAMRYLIDETYDGKNVAELTDATSYDGRAWNMKGSSFADCDELKYLNYDLYFTLRRFNDESWIRIIPGKTEEFERAKAVLARIISDSRAEG